MLEELSDFARDFVGWLSAEEPLVRAYTACILANIAFLEPGQVAGIEEAVELLFQPSELRKWRPTNDFSCDVCRRGFSSRHRRDEHQELRRDYAGSCDDADRAHNFIIRYQAAHRIDFNGAREACYEQWRRQGREL